jgi:hypothetical protein
MDYHRGHAILHGHIPERVMPMFSDPQSVTINSVAQSLPRTSVGDQLAVYTKDDETVRLTLSHMDTSKGRTRRTVRLDVNKIASDPFVANQSRKLNQFVYVVIDEPSDASFTNAEILLNVKGLVAWMTDPNLTKLIAGES